LPQTGESRAGPATLRFYNYHPNGKKSGQVNSKSVTCRRLAEVHAGDMSAAPTGALRAGGKAPAAVTMPAAALRFMRELPVTRMMTAYLPDA